MSKLISIITVVFNDPFGLEKTFSSIEQQKCERELFEYIVIDGGSTDSKTLPLIDENFELCDVTVSEPDQGIYDAMNKGARLAKGRWLLFMNAGDTFYERDSLNKIIKLLERSRSSLVYTNYIEVFKTHERLVKPPASIDVDDIKLQLSICHQASFINRFSFIKLDGFDLRYKYCADHDMIIRLLDGNHLLEKREITTCYYDTTGVSANNRFSVLNERKKILKRNGHFTMRDALSIYQYKLKIYFVKGMIHLGVINAYRELKHRLLG